MVARSLFGSWTECVESKVGNKITIADTISNVDTWGLTVDLWEKCKDSSPSTLMKEYLELLKAEGDEVTSVSSRCRELVGNRRYAEERPSIVRTRTGAEDRETTGSKRAMLRFRTLLGGKRGYLARLATGHYAYISTANCKHKTLSIADLLPTFSIAFLLHSWHHFTEGGYPFSFVKNGKVLILFGSKDSRDAKRRWSSLEKSGISFIPKYNQCL